MKIIFLSLIFIQFAFSQPTEDIIYLNDGKVVKGKIVSGGNLGDYYVQIKTKVKYYYHTMVMGMQLFGINLYIQVPALSEAIGSNPESHTEKTSS